MSNHNIFYKGYQIQRTYCVIDKDGTGNDYAFTLAKAKRCVDRLIKEEEAGLIGKKCQVEDRGVMNGN